jgi:hypothetical protein
MNQQISSLRQQTKVLIRNLYDAAQDKETFESVLGPVKDTYVKETESIAESDKKSKIHISSRPASRARLSPRKKKDPVQVVGVVRRPNKHRLPSEVLRAKPEDGDILIEKDDEFFNELQEFRKLYPESFMKSSIEQRY